MSGKFIVLEGLDGSGKTTQGKALARMIGAEFTSEPTDGAVGRLIREVLQAKERVNPRSLAALFAADRAEHLEWVAEKIEGGGIVVCDRFYLSNMAYQGADMPIEKIFEINKLVFPKPIKPDLTVFLDVSPKECVRRLNIDFTRVGREIYEEEGKLAVIRENYFRAIEMLGKTENIAVIDGSGHSSEVFNKIGEVLRNDGII